MNVLQLITPTGYFGAERWVVALARSLDPGKVRCDLAVTQEGDTAPPELLERFPDPERAFNLRMSHAFDPSVLSRLCALVRRRGIDIVHSHGYKSDTLALLVARRCGIRCVSTPHGFGVRTGAKVRAYHALGRAVHRRFDRVVPLSPALLERFRAWGFESPRLQYIANGVDTDEIDAFARSSDAAGREGGPTRGSTIGYLGRLTNGKQVDQLILAFDELWRRRDDRRLVIVGDGELREALEGLADRCASRAGIEFTGFRQDRFALLSGLDCFVMTSSSEGVPRSMMEAMALDVPVVAYDIPGVDQLVDHDATGLLAPLDDRGALVGEIERVLEDASLAERLAGAARQRVHADFSAHAMADRYTRLYEQVLQRPGRGGGAMSSDAVTSGHSGRGAAPRTGTPR